MLPLEVRTFEVTANHGSNNDTGNTALVDSVLGESQPEHTRPTLPRFLRVAAICLAFWLIPVIVLLAWLGSENVFS